MLNEPTANADQAESTATVVTRNSPSRLWNHFEELLSNEGRIGSEIPHFILALDAGDRRNLEVVLKLSELEPGRMVVIQYRLGDASTFSNLPSDSIAEEDSGVDSLFRVTLPEDVEGCKDVQLRVLSPGREFGISDVRVQTLAS